MITFDAEQSNAKFALSIEPKNEALQSYAARVSNLRSRGLPTVISRTLLRTIYLLLDFVTKEMPLSA